MNCVGVSLNLIMDVRRHGQGGALAPLENQKFEKKKYKNQGKN